MDLPSEIVISILTYLPLASTAAYVRVSRETTKLRASDALWSQVYHSSLRCGTGPTKTSHWYLRCQLAVQPKYVVMVDFFLGRSRVLGCAYSYGEALDIDCTAVTKMLMGSVTDKAEPPDTGLRDGDSPWLVNHDPSRRDYVRAKWANYVVLLCRNARSRSPEQYDRGTRFLMYDDRQPTIFIQRV